MNDYHPNLDGPAEPIGLAMDANGNLPSAPVTGSAPFRCLVCGADVTDPEAALCDECRPGVVAAYATLGSKAVATDWNDDGYLECPHCHYRDFDANELDNCKEDGETRCINCNMDFIWQRSIRISYKGVPKQTNA